MSSVWISKGSAIDVRSAVERFGDIMGETRGDREDGDLSPNAYTPMPIPVGGPVDLIRSWDVERVKEGRGDGDREADGVELFEPKKFPNRFVG